jgi:hypothetical protein
VEFFFFFFFPLLVFLQVEIDNKKEVRKIMRGWRNGRWESYMMLSRKQSWRQLGGYAKYMKANKQQQTKEGRWENRKATNEFFLCGVQIGEEKEDRK